MSFHFNGGNENIELLLRTVISANQFSVYGAVAELCNELSEGVGALGKPDAPDHLEIDGNSYRPFGETWCKNTSKNSNICPKTRNCPNYALMRV